MEKIFVYFNSTRDGQSSDGCYAEIVAEFNCESLYISCLPILEEEAKKRGMIVVEEIN